MRVKTVFVVILIISFRLIGDIAMGPYAQTSVGLDEGLVAHWRFNEGEGDLAFDETENHNDGELSCSGEECLPPTWVKGKIGYELEFDGLDDYIEIADNDTLDMGQGSFSISAWIKHNMKGKVGVVFAKSVVWQGSATEGYAGYSLHIGGIPSLIIKRVDKSGAEALATEISQDAWHHVVGVYDRERAELHLYVDGELTGESTVTKIGPVDNSLPAAIGATSRKSRAFFRGMIHELRLYHRSLRPYEIQQLYKTTSRKLQ